MLPACKGGIMIYSPLVKKAVQIAMIYHAHQFDKGGYPYILHPLHVAEHMDDEDSTIVALLHDVVEDTNCTLQNLAGTFSPTIVDAVDAVTRREGEDYFDYIRRVATNEIARKVKTADLIHNLDESRLSDAKQDASRKSRYEKALSILSNPSS